MPETTNLNSTTTGRRRSLGRKLAVWTGGLLGLLVALYFAVTSSAFIKAFVLPRVSLALNAEVSVAEASLSPLSQVILRKLQIRTAETEPLLAADEATVRYDLFTILGGKIELKEVAIQSPVVQIVTEPDGKSNLDPLLKPTASKASAPPPPTPQLAVRNLALKNGTIRLVTKSQDGSGQTVELKNLTFTVDQAQNGQTAKTSISGELKLTNAPAPGTNATNDVLQGKIGGAFDVSLSQELRPQAVKGNARFDVSSSEGTFRDLSGVSGTIEADLTPSDIRQLALRFEQGGKALGNVLLSGPFALEKTEGRLNFQIQSIDHQVLSLAAAGQGLEFGNARLNAGGVVDLAQGGSVIGASGKVTVSQLSVRRQNQTAPPVDAEVDYQVSLNLPQKSAVFEKLTFYGRQNQRDLLRASLSRPMSVNWGDTAGTLPESNFQLAVSDLDLREWGALLATNLESGRLNLQLDLHAQQNGKKLTTKLNAHLRGLTARLETNLIERAEIKLGSSGVLEDLSVLQLEQFEFEIQQDQQPLTKGTGSLRYDVPSGDLELRTDTEVALAGLLRLVPVHALSVASGRVKVNTAFSQKTGAQKVVGQLLLGDFTGQYGGRALTNFQTQLSYDVDLKAGVVQIQRAQVDLLPGGQPGGRLEFAGRYEITNRAAQMAFKIAGLNRSVLQPLLASSLGNNQLVSATLDGSGSAHYNPNGDSTLEADLRASNLVVQDARGTLPRTPVAAELQLDAGMRRQILDLRRFVLSLAPSQRAKNQLRVEGRFDLHPTNATPSQVNVEADSLDVTPVYNLLASAPGPSQRAVPAAHPAPDSPTDAKEPAPLALPFEQFSASLKIGQLYLRELAMTNLLAAAKINQGEVTLQPCQLALNGRPVTAEATLHLGVPGYRYSLSFRADKIPIEPLVNTFSTNSTGRYQGDLIAQAQIRGAGVTGANLRSNLSGQLSLSLTNLNLEIVRAKTKRLLEPIALALRVPELTQTPLNWVAAHAEIGQGRIDVKQAGVLSHAFHAQGQGTVRLADVLTNSPLDIPLSLSLRRSLAEKARLIAAEAPTNTAYVTLPAFAKLEGTLGDPKTEIDKLALLGLGLQTAGNIPKVDEKTGKLLQDIGGILSGQKPRRSSTNNSVAPSTNAAPSTSKPPKFNPFDLLELIPKKK